MGIFFKMRKKVLALLIVLLVVSLVSACTVNNGENASDTTQGTTNLIAQATEPTTESTTLPATNPTDNVEEPDPVPDATGDAENDASSTEPEEIKLVTMYATKAVNYRVGPGTTFEKEGTLPKGAKVQAVEGGKTDNGWHEILVDGEHYYVSAKYLSETKPTNNTSTGKNDTSSSSTNPVVGKYVGPANTATGVSWDGVSPIIYTYTDGTTGTKPKDGATYESRPGVTSTYTGYVVGSNAEIPADGVFHCEHCGKVCGDGSRGTCVRWLVGGNHTCKSCGKTVPGNVCHTCGE